MIGVNFQILCTTQSYKYISMYSHSINQTKNIEFSESLIEIKFKLEHEEKLHILKYTDKAYASFDCL